MGELEDWKDDRELNDFGIPSFIVSENGREVDRLVNKARKTKEEVENFIQNAIKWKYEDSVMAQVVGIISLLAILFSLIVKV